MTIFPFILDSRAACLAPQAGSGSLLLVPQSTCTLLEQIASHLAEQIQDPVTILAPFAPDDLYRKAIGRTRACVQTIAPQEHFGRLLGALEPSDWVLLVDPRHYPVRGLDLEQFLSRRPDTRAARHLVSLDNSEQGTKEYVQFDPAGQVHRIQRYYEGVTWLRASAVFCSIASVGCLRHLERPALDSLLEVRGGLAACGVPSRDVLLPGGTMDLHDSRNLLRLAEQGILHLQRHRLPSGYRLLGHNVWAAASSSIDPTARLHGPVIVQENVTVQAGATIIGPSLLGQDATVGPGATVAQCLLVRQAVVPARAVIHHTVVTQEAGSNLTQAATSPAQSAEMPMPDAGPCRVADPSMSDPPRRVYPLVKHAIDRTFAFLGLVLLTPLLILVAALIKIDSRGPLFFGHEREGKGGRVFRCWKFRTMIYGAHTQQRALYVNSGVDGPQFKIDHDPRITRIGGLLRKTNIDELPQLFNVLSGHMSLIGPRPSPFRENQICIPWRQARLSVRPGITGLWQICRSNRALGDFHQWIYYDMLYVRHMSPRLDLKILFATLITFGGRWGVPVSWIIPARRLYGQSRPWVIPMLAAEPPGNGKQAAVAAGTPQA